MTPYEERLCRTCKYGKKPEYHKPCVVYRDDCHLYEKKEEQPMHGYKIDFFTPTAQAWLSSFNTDSATECFVAVQELKKRLEGDSP